MSDLHASDIVLWSEQQAELLRRIGAGEPIEEESDWLRIRDETRMRG